MKRLTLLSLFVFFCSIANAAIDCRPMEFVSATDTEMTIGLPLSYECADPEFVISIRVNGSGLPFAPASATVSSPSPGAFSADIEGLERCTEYDILVEIYCDGELNGGCVNGVPYQTTGCDPCEDCFNFIGIVVLDSRACEFELVMDYAGTGDCGAITIISETWDYGDGTSGTGFYSTHSFPANGTYTVTGTIVFSVEGLPGTCTIVRSTEVVVTECVSCQSCFNFFGVETLDKDGCDYEFVLDYAASGDAGCGAITIISQTWDFGDGTTGTGLTETHSFPGNGTYTVTGTIEYSVAGLAGTCTAVQTADVEVTGCASCEDCFNFFGVETLDKDGCDYEFVLDYAASGEAGCGAITIISQTWDFGDGTTGTGLTETHSFPGNGTYTVTGTIEYSVAGLAGTCTAVQTADVEVTGCASCEDCFNFFGVETLDKDGCDYEFVLDYAASGEAGCGAITIISQTWDFGDGTTGTGLTETHSFPGNGTYTVTGTIEYSVAGLAGTCTAVQTADVEVTGCASCEDCFNFFGVETLDKDGCDYEFVLDYAASGEAGCGAITIISQTWDFGDGTTGTGLTETHSFPGNGTYTVTGTIEYSVAGLAGTCTAVQTTEVEVTDCGKSCDDCFNFIGIAIVDSRRCDYQLVMDYAGTGECGRITIISETWNFGDGTTGSGFFTTHSFPGDGTYTVTATIVFSVDGIDGTCTTTRTLNITVTDCADVAFEKDKIDGKSVGQGGTAKGYVKTTTVPNPASNEVTITVIDKEGKVASNQLVIVVLDMNGKQVYQSTITAGSPKKIDVSDFTSGVYLYEIRNSESVISREKLIVQ